jgi:digeranylgeranylglycerophospholipid reductase
MDKNYDLIVVGAGPAGAMAAKCAAENGARTLLLEKHERVGIPVCCAEGITTTGLEQVLNPRPEWIASTIEGAGIIGPSGFRLTFLHPRAGYILNRDVFDADLARLAVEAGAELAVSSPAVGLKLSGGNGIESVIVDHAGQKMEVKARAVIGADGIESRIAYMAGIETTISLDDIDSACQYLVDDVELENGIISIFIGSEIAPGGYAWVFPKSSHTANIGLAVCPSRSNGKIAREYLDSFIAERYPGYRRIKTLMGVVPAFQRSLPLIRGNLMLVGDAARVVDSLSGAGISNAIISGSIAGRVAAAWFRGQGNLEDYPREFFKLKRRELYAYKLFRSIFIRTTDDEFDRILKNLDEFFPQKKVQAVDVPDIIFKLIFRNPGLLKMARYLIAK